MSRQGVFVVGGLVAAVSIAVLAASVQAEGGSLLGPDLAWLEPYFATAGIIAGALGLASAALIIGLGVGRWSHPRPLSTSAARRREGLPE